MAGKKKQHGPITLTVPFNNISSSYLSRQFSFRFLNTIKLRVFIWRSVEHESQVIPNLISALRSVLKIAPLPQCESEEVRVRVCESFRCSVTKPHSVSPSLFLALQFWLHTHWLAGHQTNCRSITLPEEGKKKERLKGFDWFNIWLLFAKKITWLLGGSGGKKRKKKNPTRLNKYSMQKWHD